MAAPQQVEQFIRQSEEYVRRNISSIERLLTSQRAHEVQIIQRTDSFCPVSELQDRSIRAEDIKKALSEGFGDSTVFKSLMCMNNAMVALPQSAGLSRNYKIRQYLRDLQQIGGESAEGYAMAADVKGTVSDGDDLFVVKAPRDISPELRENQVHEYFVGAFGTNILRSYIPNFAYVLGIFQCSPPYIDNQAYVDGRTSDRPALTYCQNNRPDNQVNYLLYENVANSKTLRDFIIDGATFQDYLAVLIQITLALSLAYRTIDFTHYDLHDENVLVRELPEEIEIPYMVDGKETVRYMRTRYVATIIDLGRSHIKYQDHDYGYALVEAGTYPDRSYPMYDIYKLVMFTLASAAFGKRNMQSFNGLSDSQMSERNLFTNPDVFQNGKELISFFVTNLDRDPATHQLLNAAQYLIDTRPYFYILPYYPEYNIDPINFYENAIRVAFPQTQRWLTEEPSTDRVYGCYYKGICKTLQGALMEYTHPDTAYIDDPYTFYEISVETGTGYQMDRNTVRNEGAQRYEQYMERLRLDRRSTINQLNRLLQNISVISLRYGASDVTRFQNVFLDMYRRFVAKIVKATDLFTDINTNKLVVDHLNNMYPNKARQPVSRQPYTYQQLAQAEFAEARRNVPVLNQSILSIQEDIDYVNQLDYNQVLRFNPEASWLFQKLPTLAAAIAPV